MSITLSEQDRWLHRNNRNIGFNKHQTWTCDAPYLTVNVARDGSCYACYSASWLPISIGNVFEQSIEKIWTGQRADYLRSTVTAGKNEASFFHCNSRICPRLTKINKSQIDKIDLQNDQATNPIDLVRGISRLNLDYDHTCNLSCPSCRKSLFVDKRPELAKITDRVIDYLETVTWDMQIKLNGGEPFMSESYLRIMRWIADHPDSPVTLEIATNGSTLITNTELIHGMVQHISSFRVSFDAATEVTYQQIRRGGNWNHLLKNARHLASIRSKNLFRFQSDFLVQADNYREIPQYVDLASDIGFDVIAAQRIWNWGTRSEAEHRLVDVLDPSHPDNPQAIAIIKGIDHDRFKSHWTEEWNENL